MPAAMSVSRRRRTPSRKEEARLRAVLSILKLAETFPDEMLAVLLETSFWPRELTTDTSYDRYDDISQQGMISVNLDRGGGAWIATTPADQAHCFCSITGNGQSPRVNKALAFVAVAIQLDNGERPQDRKS